MRLTSAAVQLLLAHRKRPPARRLNERAHLGLTARLVGVRADRCRWTDVAAPCGVRRASNVALPPSPRNLRSSAGARIGPAEPGAAERLFGSAAEGEGPAADHD